MTPRRLSLAEIAKEDNSNQDPPALVAEQPAAEPPIAPPAPAAMPPSPPSWPAQSSQKRTPKADFVKLSVTMPPEMFEMLQDLSRERRRQKLPFTLSDIVREAIVARYCPPS